MKKKLLIVLLAVVLAVGAVIFAFANREPEYDFHIPRMYFEGDISEMLTKEDERNITVRYEDGDNSFEGYASLKVQGTSSLAYDKKNYTIKLYADEAHDEKLYVDVGWGEQTKYCLKANWIDKTHARNVVTANIVTEVQQKYGLLEQAPENGAVDGFPIEIFINGDFLGIYTFNIPKDAWMFAMDEDNPDHIVICGEGWKPANLFEAMPDFKTWAVEVGEESDETLEKMNRLFDFVINSTDEEFKSDFEQYINLDAALNYHVISRFAHLADNVGKNMLLATYDGQVWYPCLYDLDTSWGTASNGLELEGYKDGVLYLDRSNFWARLEENFGKELSERYFELRQDILTKENVMGKFQAFEDSIPDASFKQEVKRWGRNIPGYDISQIEEFLSINIDRLDEVYTTLGSN